MADSELFNSYESDFKLAYNEAQSKLASISGLEGDARRNAMRSVEKVSDECFEVIDQMSLEIQNIPTQSRSTYNAKLRTFRQDVEGLKSDLKKLMDDEDRKNLFGADYQRQQLLQGNSSLENSTNKLRDSSRIALETEDIGASILNDLRSQREQIMNSRNTLAEADSYMDRSLRTLKTMTRRMAANKMITYAIIAVLILLILLVLISKFW